MTTTSDAQGLDLDAIKAREEAATEGPWYQGRASRQYETDCDVFSGPDMETAHDIATYCWSAEDATFITKARTDVPLLVAEIERLREELDGTRINEAYAVRKTNGFLAQLAAIAALVERSSVNGTLAPAVDILDGLRIILADPAGAIAKHEQEVRADEREKVAQELTADQERIPQHEDGHWGCDYDEHAFDVLGVAASRVRSDFTRHVYAGPAT